MKSLWGSDCGRIKIIGNKIQSVNSKTGEKSQLFEDIFTHIKTLSPEEKGNLQEKYKSWEGKYVRDISNDKELSLAVYANSTSENFNKLGFKKDSNGDFKFEDVKKELLSPKSEKFQQKPGTEGSTASPETIEKYKEAAKRMGFDMKELSDGLYDSKGNKIDANGVTDILARTIEIANGKLGVAAGEEVSHVAVRIVKKNDPALFSKMMNEIGKYQLYFDTVDKYKNDPDYQLENGKPNIPKLKEEAIGKVFNEHVINRLEGTTEKPELLTKANTFWGQVKESIKNLLNKLGMDFTSSAIEKGAKQFTEGKITDKKPVKDLTDKKEGEDYENFKQRTLSEIQDIAANVPDKTAIVTHGSVIGLLKRLDQGKTGSGAQVDNGEIYSKEVNGKTLYFVRHGQSEANIAEGEMKNKNTAETPLTAQGRQDARDAAKKLKELGVTNVVNTDTKRTSDTAKILREELGLKDTFKQKTDEEKKKDEIDNLFSKVSVQKEVAKKDDGEGESHYEDNTTGKTVNRVTGLVHDFLTKLFKNKNFSESIDKVLQDFKKQFGTANHEDIANMHERHIDSATGLLKETPDPLDSNFVPQSGNMDYYNTLEGYLYGYTDKTGLKHTGLINNKTVFPDGTKFLWEKTIYDPTNKINGVRGLAGTVDFMAIKPDGKVSILDWKFLGSLVKNEGIRDYMKKAYDKQMFGYTSILTSPTYGIKASDIEMARMIPIAVHYSEEEGHVGEITALNIGNADYSMEKTPYLLPYVTASEQSDDKQIQGLVNSLVHTLNLTAAKGSSEKDILIRKNKLANIERAILHLQLAKDFGPLIEQVKSFHKESIDNLKKIRQDYVSFDFKGIKNLKELDSRLEPLIDIIKSLQLYKNLDKFEDFVDDKTTEGKNLREQLHTLSRQAKYLLEATPERVGAEGLLNQYVKSWADSRSIWDILNPQNALDYLAKEFRNPSKSPSVTIRAAYDLNNIRLHKVDQESNDMVEKIKPIWEKITKEWGGVKKLSDLIEAKGKDGKGLNKLIGEFSTETYDKLENLIKAKNHEEVRKLISSDKFDSWATSYREEQIKQIKSSQWVAAYGKSAEERQQEAVDKVMSETTWSSEYAMYNFGRLKGFLKEDLQSNEFKNLYKPENKPALDFYNFTLDINKQAVAAGIFHDSHMSTFLPWIEKSLADKVAYGGRWNAWDQVRKAFTSMKSGDDVEQIDPLTNQVISKIPKYFVREISRTGKEGEIDHSNVSDDLIKNVGLFAQSVIDYRSKIEMENIFDALKAVEEAKGMILTDSHGNRVGQSSENKNLQPLVDFLEVHINDKGILSKLDFKGGHIKIDGEDRVYDVRKSLDTLKTYFAFNVLGFNSVTSLFRSLTTGTTGLYNAGKWYTTKEFLSNYAKFINFTTFRNDASLTTKLMRAFLPVEENLQLDLDHLAGSKTAEADFQAMSMKMVKSAHNIVQYVNYLSHMENAIIINGKLMNAREYANKNVKKYELSYSERKDFENNLDKTVKELIEKHGLINHSKVDENGKLSIEGLDMNDFSVADFKDMIRVQGRMLSGNISENDQSHIRSNALARQMFLFTNWLPQSIDQRFGGLSYNQGTQSYEYGRMRMVMKMAIDGEGGVLDKLKNLSNMYRANETGVTALNKMYEQHKADYLKKTGLELHMTSDEFNDMVRDNMKIMGKEIIGILSFISLSLGLSAALPKKDDQDWEQAQGFFAYMRRVINRGRDEMTMFVNPLSFAQFGSGAKLPMLGLFQELSSALSHLKKFGYGIATGDEDLDKIHVIPQIIHTIPNGKAIYDVGQTAFPDWFKEQAGTTLNPEPLTK